MLIILVMACYCCRQYFCLYYHNCYLVHVDHLLWARHYFFMFNLHSRYFLKELFYRWGRGLRVRWEIGSITCSRSSSGKLSEFKSMVFKSLLCPREIPNAHSSSWNAHFLSCSASLVQLSSLFPYWYSLFSIICC